MASVAIVTLGCPKNAVSSRDMRRALIAKGNVVVEQAGEADVVLINSCGFIEAAKRESIDTTLSILQNKATPAQRVYLVGCFAQRNADELATAIPELDGVIGFEGMPDLIASIMGSGGAAAAPAPLAAVVSPWAYLQIADGCSRTCAFCVIPGIKGAYHSFPREDVLTEAALLAREGAKELVVVAQDTGLYGTDIYGRASLGSLLRELGELDEVRWLRLMYSHPTTLGDDVLAELAKIDKLCAYIDLPLQHASPDVLTRMRRPGSAAEYLRLIKRLRDRMPGLWLRTELIVGFPGETREDFQRLCRFVEEARPDYCGVFEFSREQGAPAADLDHQVSAGVKGRRFQYLRDLADEVAFERKARLVGESLDVVIDGRDEAGAWVGRYEGQAPEIDGEVTLTTTSGASVCPGDLVPTKVIEQVGYDLRAEML